MLRRRLRPSSAVAGLLLFVACAHAIDRIVGPPETAEKSARGNSTFAVGEMRTVLGPRLFVRNTGAPATENVTLEGYAPEATLRIANGDANGQSRVTSGTVLVDGKEVVHPSDFSQKVASITVPITLLNTSVISVHLASAPGSQLTLSVDGRPATSASVSSSGGTIHLLGSQVLVVAPTGAVGGTVQLTAEPVTSPRPETVPGTSIEMGPSGTVFSAPVTLSIAYDAAALPVGARPSSLKMKWWNVDHWESLAGNAVDLARGIVSAQTTHFSTFSLLGTEVVFCPGDAGAVGDLQTALDNVPVDGTVYVCDGQFAVQPVVIRKPLTLRSLNPGGATLADAEAGGNQSVGTAILGVDGVASGLVRITDIGLLVTDRGIEPAGTFDKVEVDNVRFTSPPGASAVGVRVGASSVTGARVDVTNSEFTQMGLGVWPVQAVETNVRHSHFDRFGGGGLSYSHGNTAQTQSFGRIEDNVFTNCGPSGCIRILTAGAVTVARNRFEALDQPVTLGAITVQAGTAYPNPGQLVIEDNVIISRRTGSSEATPAGWMFQAGIYLSDPSDRTHLVRRNHVTDAYSGVTSTASVSAMDNWFTGGVYGIRQTALRAVAFQRNDMVGLLGSFAVPNAGTSVQCNWWGSTAGPVAPPSGTQWAYTPWANEPIAGTTVPCTPVSVPPVPPVATITVSPNPWAVLAGGTQQFTATGRDASGNVIAVTPVWSVTNGGGSISAGGLFTAGTVAGNFVNTVRATSGSVFGTATVGVGPIAQVFVSPNPASVLTGSTVQFFAPARDANGYQLNSPTPVVWSVVNGGGSISASGLFTPGTTPGTFANTVTAAYGTVTNTATVTVGTLASVSVTPNPRTLSPGGTQQFTATGKDGNGNAFPITPVWTVASGGGTITSSGVFTAGAAGGTYTNTVTATFGGFTGAATVTIASVATITVTPNPRTLIAGTTGQFSATARDAGGTVVQGAPITWSVTSSGGTISPAGLFTAGATPGTFANTVRATSGTTSGTATVTVISQALATVFVCSTAGGGVTVSTVAEAIALVAAGGTINLCPGAHVEGNLNISKPVTITTEGPDMPSLEASGSSGQVFVSGRTPGAVTISRLRLKGFLITSDTGSLGGSLSVENNVFEDCGTYACVSASMPSRIVGNSFTAHIEHPLSSAVVLGSYQGANPKSYTVTDNTIVGIGNDPAQANWWSRYPMTSAAINVLSGAAEISRNHVTNSFWGIIASPYPSRPTLTMTAVDNVVQSTYFPIGRSAQFASGGSVTMNWNDVSDFSYLSSDSSSGVINLRCNWWGQVAGPTNVSSSAKKFYTPFATSPVAGQPHTGCDASGAALASITVTPNPATLVAGATQQFVATGYDGNGNVTPVTPVWSVPNGGGTIDASAGLFTAGANAGTFTSAIRATSGLVSGTATIVVTAPPPAAVVRVCNTAGAGVTVATLGDALARVTSGGTVLLCDGVHSVGNVFVPKPVTITAEGPGTPTLERTGPSGLIWVNVGTPGDVTLSKLRLKGLQVSTDSGGAGARLVVEQNDFEDCGTYACVQTSMPSRIVNNTFTAHIEHPLTAAVVLGATPYVPRLYTVSDNTVVGIGSDPSQVNWQNRYPITAAAIYLLSGTAEVTRNHITNAFWGIVAVPDPSRLAVTVTAVDNVIRTTYFPIGRVGAPDYPSSLTMNWNDVSDYTFLSSDATAGLLNLRCNWWGQSGGPTNVSLSSMRFYAPFATSPVAGQPHTGCDASGAALASITVTPNPSTLVAGATQQFVATGYDGNGNVTPVSPVWSVPNGGGTIDASAGLFTAGANAGTFTSAIRATSGLVSGTATIVVTAPPPAAVVRVCSTSGTGVTVATLGDALARVTSGGTVLICDGTHASGNLVVSKPVTITAEGPGTPTLQAGSQTSTWWVLGSAAGVVEISRLHFKGHMLTTETGSAGASLTLDGNAFEDCELDNGCVIVSMPSRIVNNTFTARLDHHVNVALVLGSQPSTQAVYTVTDNRFDGVGYDATQANVWARYPLGEAIEVNSGVAEVSRNSITNAFWGIVASLDASRPASAVTAFDNIVRSTYFPVGRVGDPSLPASFTANWNDITDFRYLESDLPAGVLNLRCNWWGDASGPASMSPSIPVDIYTPFAVAPVARQSRTSCTP